MAAVGAVARAPYTAQKMAAVAATPQRRLELLALARRQRQAWLDEALGAPAPGSESSRRSRELEVVEGATKEVFESASGVVRFLATLLPEDEATAPLLPLEDDTVERELRVALRPAAARAYSGAGTPARVAVVVELLKHPDCADVVRSMQRFVAKVYEAAAADEPATPSDAAAPERIASFVRRCAAALNDEAPWRDQDEAQRAATADALEALLYRKLHGALAAPDDARDLELAERLRALSFLDWRHLEVSGLRPDGARVDETAAWAEALALFGSLDEARSPREKAELLEAASRCLGRALGKSDDDVAADDLLPAIILAVKAANPARLASNVAYLEARALGFLMGAAGYVAAQFLSAVTFLRTADAGQVDGVDAAEWARLLRAARDRAAPAPAAGAADDAAPLARERAAAAGPPVSARDVRAARLARSAAVRKPPAPPRAAAPRRPKKPTFKFVGADPDLLPPAAVRELLADYHRLAARVEALEKQVATSKAR